MDTYTYEKIAEDLKSGIKHNVVNEETHVMGEVRLCNHGYFNVHIGNGEEIWASNKCREVTAEEEWKYHKTHSN